MPVATTTALAIGGLAASAATTGMSFAQMSKQNKLQKQAEADAAKAMAEARKKLEVNYYDQLSVKKEPYELAREAALAAGAQAIEAGRESERGAAATAGRVQMAQTEEQRKIASEMGQEMSNLEQLSATEDARLRDIGVQLDIGEAEGAQKAARDAAEAKAAATTQAMEGVTSMVKSGAELLPLYGKDYEGMAQGLSNVKLTPEQATTFGTVKGFENMKTDFSGLSNFDKSQAKSFYNALTPDQMKMLFSNQSYTDYLKGINK
mgnify:CR=1 FL=1